MLRFTIEQFQNEFNNSRDRILARRNKMRSCDFSICQEPAISVGGYTEGHGFGLTKAACSPAHQAELDDELRALGYEPKWKPVPHAIVDPK